MPAFLFYFGVQRVSRCGTTERNESPKHLVYRCNLVCYLCNQCHYKRHTEREGFVPIPSLYS